MLLANLVETSSRISNTSRRLEKTALLADLLKQLTPEEVETAVAFLSGGARQGRIGIGYATLRGASATPAETPALQLMDEIGRAHV